LKSRTKRLTAFDRETLDASGVPKKTLANEHVMNKLHKNEMNSAIADSIV
jgi:hypothetical protein